MKPIFIVGPTAAGKSALALTVARRWGGVICAADAFQIYRRMDIGTGKPTISEQAAVPHYLLNLRGPLDNFNVAEYLREAERALMVMPTQVPQIWVGGAGLYVRALRQGLTLAPESDPELARTFEGLPLAMLRQEIKKLDPAWCATADLQNPRRIIRALTVVKQTGRPLSEWRRERSAPLLADAAGIFLSPPRERNRELIAARVRKMWDEGWPDEVRGLLTVSGWRESQSARALGYLTVVDYLSGKLSKDACLEKIILLTCQYAKRQETWFKMEPGFTVTGSVEDGLKKLLRDNRFPEN
ncbi:MAG: tRNA (adenosine(37)-N6)-dimethylallyltransferase MiaA [Verrucomicrobiales bacterium]|nr:tRNA (adenosine(37)-N6)-dimethylallyltransferase MiaA [Verrucomicrobiales bacterium]